MSLAPFTQNQTSPLSLAPYYSRIPSQELGSTTNNYVMTGFRPGYALQASELNEIQERFFLNQTLTVTMISNWGAAMTNYGPGWGSSDATGTSRGGLTPISPNMITKSGNNITFSAGWYLAQIPIFDNTENTDIGDSSERNFKVWIYSDVDRTCSITGTNSGYIGFNITQEYVTDTEDPDLNDNSSGDAGNNGPGATRYKLVISGLGSEDFTFNGTTLLSGEKSPMAIRVESSNVSYLNGYPIQG